MIWLRTESGHGLKDKVDAHCRVTRLHLRNSRLTRSNHFRESTLAQLVSLSLVIDYEHDWGDIKSITAWGQSDGSATRDVDVSQLDVIYQSTIKGGNNQPWTILGQDIITVGSQIPELEALIPGGLPLALVAQPGDSIRAKVKLDTENVAVLEKEAKALGLG